MQTAITFGTDGIRGVAGQFPLDHTTLVHIGHATGQWFVQNRPPVSQHQALIGTDTRQSRLALTAGIADGLTAAGIVVSPCGIVTTPELAYLTQHHSHHPIGIMLTASHNPYDQNGIKIFDSDGFKLPDADERAIEALIAEALAANGKWPGPPPFWETVPWANPNTPMHAGYVRFLLDSLAGSLPPGGLDGFTVVVDCANGAAYEVARMAFFAVGATAHMINVAPDGTNINREAGSEYVRRDRSALLKAIRAQKADLGIALDGDADRVVFVTPDGTLIDGDHVLGILAAQMQAQGALPGNTVVATDMSNSGLEDFLRERGITLVRTKVGDRYVMERMRTGGFALGGEQAGHVILLDGKHTVGDGLYIGLGITALAAYHKRTGGPTLNGLAAQIPRYPQVIASAQMDRQTNLGSVPRLDKLRTDALAAFDGKGRVNVRFSGTEPNLLRAMVEGGPANTLREVVHWARLLCQTVGSACGTPDPPIDLVDCMTGARVANA